MNKASLYISLLLAVLAAASCKKDGTGGESAGPGIRFSAEDGVTSHSSRALLSDRTLKTNDNRIQVLDMLAGFTGTASWMDGNLYIKDEIVYNGNVVWGYRSGKSYPWTTDGSHQFFGWLSYDTSMSLTADSYFGATLLNNFSQVNRTLSIPAKEMTTDTQQFDFLYANTSNYIMPAVPDGAVPLAMQHLFSAISIQLRNESQDAILVKNVTIEGLKNKKSAIISFVGAPALTTLTASSEFLDNGLYYALSNEVKTLADGETYDLLARVKNTAVGEYRLIWPQSVSDLAPSDEEDYMTYPITVSYEYVNDEEHIQHTAHLRFPEGTSFNPGTRYSFTLLFTQKHIQLTFRVNPWNYMANEWSFTDNSISEVTELDFDKTYEGYNKPARTCTIVGGTPVKGTFSIVNPTGAKWSIEPVGDVEYFTISPNQGTIDSANPDYEFYVIPNLDPNLDRSSEKKLRFRFYVQFTDGTVHDANSEVNRKENDGREWTIILPKI